MLAETFACSLSGTSSWCTDLDVNLTQASSGKKTLNWEDACTRLARGKACGVLSWLTIDVGGPSLPWAVLPLGWPEKQAGKQHASRSAKLPSGTDGVWPERCECKEHFPHQAASSWQCFITPTETLPKTATIKTDFFWRLIDRSCNL